MEPNLANYWWFEHLLSLDDVDDEVVNHFADLFPDLNDGSMPASVSARFMLRHIHKHASDTWDYEELLTVLGTLKRTLNRQDEFRAGTAALVPSDELVLQVLVMAVISHFVDDWMQWQLIAAPKVLQKAETLLQSTLLADEYQHRDDLQDMLASLQQLFECGPTEALQEKLAKEFPTPATVRGVLVEFATEAWSALGPSTLELHQHAVMSGKYKLRPDPMIVFLANNLPDSMQGQQEQQQQHHHQTEVGSQEEQQHTADAAAALPAATPGHQMMAAAAAVVDLVIPSSTAEKLPAGGAAIRSPSSNIPSIPSPKTDVEEPAAAMADAPGSNTKPSRASRRADQAAAVKKPLDLEPSRAAARKQPAPAAAAATTRQAAKAAAAAAGKKTNGVKGSERNAAAAAAAAAEPAKQKKKRAKRIAAAPAAAAAAASDSAESDSVVTVGGSSSDGDWDSPISDAGKGRGVPASSPPQRGKVVSKRKQAAAAAAADSDGDGDVALIADDEEAGRDKRGAAGKKQRQRQICGGAAGKTGRVVLWDSEETPGPAENQQRKNMFGGRSKEGATMAAAAAAKKRMEAAAAAAVRGEDREDFEFRAGSASEREDEEEQQQRRQQQEEEGTSDAEAAPAAAPEGAKRKQIGGQRVSAPQPSARPAAASGGTAAAAGSQAAPQAKRKRYSRWSKAEEDLLIELVTRHGEGCWGYLKELGGDGFNDRSGVDLKDKWRNIKKARGDDY